MESISPTRMNLLARRSQISLAFQGVDLLKRKRDALVADFFDMVRQAYQQRDQLEKLSQKSYLALALAKSHASPEVLDTLGALGARSVQASIETRNIWGVRVPDLQSPPLRRLPHQRGWNPQWQSYTITQAADAFESFLESLVPIAGLEIKIQKMGSEIKKTTRRVNALEQVVIPRLREEIAYIKSVLEQREREDMFRLKRVKQKKEQEAASFGEA
ncbi:MAG: V-type ATP synthase subunit D [Coprothermobacterota bacterium]|nr:V-type ATP synthase subunit D [Coprothermobacterota bacterium]